MVVLIIIAIVFLLIGFYLFVKFALMLFNRKHIIESKNPYISAQKIKIRNDLNYEDYLAWMDKKGNGVVFDKMLTKEDFIAQQKIDSQLN